MSSRTSVRTPAGPFSLDEVQAAVRALRAGEFRGARPADRPTNPTTERSATRVSRTGCDRNRLRADAGDTDTGDTVGWSAVAGERVIAVVGSAGSTGASTVALATAMAAASPGSPARVVECCSASASGLAAATTAELGLHPSGWRQGKRDHVLIERASEVLAGVDEVPGPTPADDTADGPSQLTILDIGWEIGQLTATDSWVTDALAAADQIVVVTSATVPGMRRLEGTLELLATHDTPADSTGGILSARRAARPVARREDRTWVAVRGPRRRKWPRGIEHAGGLAARRALAGDRVVEIPEDRVLAVHGLDSRPLPPLLVSAAARLLRTPAAAPAVPSDDREPGPPAPQIETD